jgi:broad specificity phosphatase PhoE
MVRQRFEEGRRQMAGQSAAAAKAGEVAGRAQEQAAKAAEGARGRLRDQVDQRSTEAGERVRAAAGDARSVAEELRESDGDRILADVEDFARRNTGAVVAGGLVIGVAASRLLKASSQERYRRTTAEPARLGAGRPPVA